MRASRPGKILAAFPQIMRLGCERHSPPVSTNLQDHRGPVIVPAPWYAAVTGPGAAGGREWWVGGSGRWRALGNRCVSHQVARAVRAEPVVVAAAKMMVVLPRRLSTAGMFDLFQRAGGFRFRFSSEPDGDPAAPWGSGRTCTGPVRHCSITCVDRTLYSRDCEGRFNQLADPPFRTPGSQLCRCG